MIAINLLKTACISIFICVALPASANIQSPAASHAFSNENPRIQQLSQRLKEIKSMDMGELTSSEKKNLRKEVRAIKKELKGSGRGIYLSVGAIIIIILLLILLV